VSGPAEDAPLAAPVVVARNRFFGPPGVLFYVATGSGCLPHRTCPNRGRGVRAT